MSSDDNFNTSIIEDEQLFEFINSILSNLINQIEIIKKNLQTINEVEITEILNHLEEKNDAYSKLLIELNVRSTFLPINRLHLLFFTKSIEDVTEKIERVAHRLGLAELPDWTYKHFISMIDILREQFSKLTTWIYNKPSHLNLKEIELLENEADILHRKFLKRIYSSNLKERSFNQTELLDRILEDAIDETEILARRFYIILNEYKSALGDTPHYLP